MTVGKRCISQTTYWDTTFRNNDGPASETEFDHAVSITLTEEDGKVTLKGSAAFNGKAIAISSASELYALYGDLYNVIKELEKDWPNLV